MDDNNSKDNEEELMLVDDLELELKSCQTGAYDLLNEYRVKLEQFQKENINLASENEKFKLAESEKCKKLSDENKELSVINLNLKEDLIAYQFKLANMKKLLIDEEKTFKQELETHQARISESQEEIERLKRECSDCRQNFEAVKKEKERALEYVQEYMTKLEKFENKLAEQQQDATKMLEQRVADLNAQIESMTKEKNFRIGQLSIKVSHLETRLTAEFNENANLKRTNEANESLISELKSQLETSEKEVTRLTDLVKLNEENEKKLTDKIHMYESDFLKLNKEVTLLKKENSTLNENYARLESQSISYRKKIEIDSNLIEQAKKENESLTSKMMVFANEIEQMLVNTKLLKERELDAHEALTQQDRFKVKPLEKEVKTLKKQLRIKQVQLCTSESLFNKQNDEFNQVYAKLEDALREKSEFESKLNELKSILELKSKVLKEVSDEKLLLEKKLVEFYMKNQRYCCSLREVLKEIEAGNGMEMMVLSDKNEVCLKNVEEKSSTSEIKLTICEPNKDTKTNSETMNSSYDDSIQAVSP